MNAKKRQFIKRAALNACFPPISVAVLIAVYAIASAVMGDSLILPQWNEIFIALGALLSKSSFYKAFGFTLLRVLISFSCALVIGCALAAAAFYSKIVRKLLMPIMTLLRAIPTMSIIFLLVLWFRSSYAPAVIAFILVMPMFYSSCLASLEGLDEGIFEMSRVYKVPKTRVLTKFILPQVAPPMIDAAAGNLSFTVKLVIAGEALAQTALSLGGMLNIANVYLETARLMAITVFAVAVCFLLEGLVLLLKLPSRRWR